MTFLVSTLALVFSLIIKRDGLTRFNDDRSFFISDFQSPHQGAFPSFLQLLAHIPVIIINQVVRLPAQRINQQQRPLKILDHLFIRQFRRQQTGVNAFGLRFVAFDVEQDKGFPQLDMLVLVDAELADDHHAAKHQQHEEDQHKAVSSEKAHET